MRVCPILLLAAVLVSSTAVAQETRDDGLRALLLGDYLRAAQILGPLAEDPRSPDHAAQFMVAMLYDSGRGVRRNTFYACRLFMAAAANPGPFAEQASQLARRIRDETGVTGACGSIEPPPRVESPAPLFMRSVPYGALSFALDGLLAIARGDYDEAARLLRISAESDVSTDRAAQFLMATLYENGHGVARDPLRACALYDRASLALEAPFGAEALRLMMSLSRVNGNEWFAECQALATLGLEHGFLPVTFELGPGHSITWTITGAVITYQGRSTSFPWRVAQRGATVLPLRHTMIASRDFIEMFVWQPTGREWSLQWHLFEVTRDEVRVVASFERLLTRDTQPRATETIDQRALVRLEMNTAGAVEWARVTDGTHATIDSAEALRTERDAEAARAAALARTDWSQRFDLARRPALRYASSEGCAHMVLSALSDDRTEALAIVVDAKSLGIGTVPRTLDLARETRRVSVSVRVYDRALRQLPFCSRAGEPASQEIWRAVTGRMTIQVFAGSNANNTVIPRATIRLEAAEFVNAAGTRVRLTTPIVVNTRVVDVSEWRF